MRSSVTSEMRNSPSDIITQYRGIAESAERAVCLLNRTYPFNFLPRESVALPTPPIADLPYGYPIGLQR